MLRRDINPLRTRDRKQNLKYRNFAMALNFALLCRFMKFLAIKFQPAQIESVLCLAKIPLVREI